MIHALLIALVVITLGSETESLPFFPLMTVYDFFIKRALDQLYYNLYWGSSFVLVGTPSGVTLAP